MNKNNHYNIRSISSEFHSDGELITEKELKIEFSPKKFEKYRIIYFNILLYNSEESESNS